MTKILTENRYLIFNPAKKRGLKNFVKSTLNFCHQFLYKPLYFVLKPGRHECRYKVSVCAIFKNEAAYLKEWVEFHLIAGVEHFYLYDNNSDDNFREILAPYVERGIVQVKNWPKPQSQMEAYKDFMETSARETMWVGFIDIDEFVVPKKMNSIYDFLKDFENRPSVIIYWRYFGSSGKIQRDTNSLVTEDFVSCWQKIASIGKFFFNTKYEYSDGYRRNGYMHYTWAKFRGIHLPPVNVFDRVCTFGCNPVPSDDFPIQINHYLLKSYGEFAEKKSKRGGGVHPLGFHNMEYFFAHEQKCTGVDFSAYKFLTKLKIQMQK